MRPSDGVALYSETKLPSNAFTPKLKFEPSNECHRKEKNALDHNNVHYMDRKECKEYEVDFIPYTNDMFYKSGKEMFTEKGELMFVVNDGKIYAREKVKTKRQSRYQHSSFFSGGDVDYSGVFKVKSNILVGVVNSSGHYKPTLRHLYGLLNFLQSHKKVNLKNVFVQWISKGLFFKKIRGIRVPLCKKLNAVSWMESVDKNGFDKCRTSYIGTIIDILNGKVYRNEKEEAEVKSANSRKYDFVFQDLFAELY